MNSHPNNAGADQSNGPLPSTTTPEQAARPSDSIETQPTIPLVPYPTDRGSPPRSTSPTCKPESTSSPLLLAPSSTTETSRHAVRFSVRDWWWEIISWTLGSIFLFALIALLISFNNKRLDTWRSDISINAMVSVLAQAAQSSLLVSLNSGISQMKWDWLRKTRPKEDIQLFDDASRGPLGSLDLLWKHVFERRRIHPVLIGALATALMVAFSTFAQQAIGIGNRTVRSAGNAAISRANNFTTNFELQGQEIEYAALSAFSRDNISYSEVTTDCPGLQCVWDSYESLGVCATTHPRVSKVAFECGRDFTTCKVTSEIDAAYDTVALETIAQVFYSSDKFIDFGMYSWPLSRTEPATSPDGIIMDTVEIYASRLNWVPFDDMKTNATSNLIDFIKITLSLCIHTFRTIVTIGRTITTLLHSSSALTEDPRWTWAPDDVLSTYHGCGEAGTISACLSVYDFYNSGQILDYLSKKLLDGASREGNLVLMSLYDDFGSEDSAERIAARMQNVAVSLSNGMRLSPHSAEPVSGTIEILEQYFTINFLWMILPVALWAGTTAFLLTTIGLTYKHSIPAWKASPIVLLDCKNENACLDSDRLVKKQVKEHDVTLSLVQKDGWWTVLETDSGEMRAPSSWTRTVRKIRAKIG